MIDMVAVLVDHQRQNSSRCLCGWAELGKSHPEHVAAALSAAGFGQVQGEKRLMQLAALLAYDAIEEGALRTARAEALEQAADTMPNPSDGWGMNQRTWLRAQALPGQAQE